MRTLGGGVVNVSGKDNPSVSFADSSLCTREPLDRAVRHPDLTIRPRNNPGTIFYDRVHSRGEAK